MSHLSSQIKSLSLPYKQSYLAVFEGQSGPDNCLNFHKSFFFFAVYGFMARGARGAPKDGGNFQGSRQKRRENLSPNAHASKASLRPAMFSTIFTPVKLTSKNGKVSDEFWLESKRTCNVDL